MIKSLLKRWLFPVQAGDINRTVIIDGRLMVTKDGRSMIVPLKIVALSPREAAGAIHQMAGILGMNEGQVDMEAVEAKNDTAAVKRLLTSLDLDV